MAQRRRCGGPRLALLLCLLALSRHAAGQGLLDMLLEGAGATPAVPAGDATATPTPTGDAAAVPATPVTGEGQPAATPTPTGDAAAVPATPVAGEGQPAATPTPTGDAAAVPATPVAGEGQPAATTPTPTSDAAAVPATPVAGEGQPAATTPTPAAAAPAVPVPATTTPGAATPATPVAAAPGEAATPAAGASTIPQPLNAGEVTSGTPPVALAPGADGAEVIAVGTIGTEDLLQQEDQLPPAPPMSWQTLQKDCQLVFSIEIRGSYIVPFTSPKATVIARVLRDRYLRSAQLPDISVASLNSFTYLSYDTVNGSDLGAATDDALAASGALGTAAAGGRRRLARAASSRRLLQIEKSGAELKIVVATASVRTDSEIESVTEGVDSGRMARDFTLAGIDTENLTLLMPPYQEDLIGPGNVNEEGSGGTQSWIIGVAVGVVLLVLPGPLFLLVRWRKRKNREAREVQAAEAEAMRQRMHSKMMRPGSKSFTIRPGSSADIMVRSGSVGGLVGYNANGRLQSWSGSPERQYGQYNAYGVSRQTSVTSLGSTLPSARGGSYSARSSLPNTARTPYAAPMAPPPGAYEEELQTARSVRSQSQYGGS